MPMVMGTNLGVSGIFAAVFGMLLDVAVFWKNRLISWYRSKSPRVTLLHRLDTAKSYEEWEEAAFQLDVLMSTDLWRQNPTSRHYDYRLILGRREAIIDAREEGDILTLVNLLRSGLVRNLGNITSHKLFNHAYAGTKLLIDDYITQVAGSIKDVANLETPPESGFTSQAKLELLHDTRQAFGRSTLVLHGGPTFGLCHLGVVKALHLRGLLPRIITGTGTGALVAALVGIHTEDELLSLLSGDGIDLSAFEKRSNSLKRRESEEGSLYLRQAMGWYEYLKIRVDAFFGQAFSVDANVLEECVKANVGDLTFEEAYERTKRVLNITVATSGKGGFPNLLNYLTAPNVLIWSAALASNASSTTMYMYPPVHLYCKDERGSIVRWSNSEDITFNSWGRDRYDDRESPLFRIAELFNVNHFIVSQAKLYLIPFLQPDVQRPDQRAASRFNLSRSLIGLILSEIQHRLKQLDYLGLLPTLIRSLLVEENIPGPSWTLLPDLSYLDLKKLLESPSKENIDYWILRGERSVWPAISALKVRCAIEVELDKEYQRVRRRPYDGLAIGAKRRRSSGESVPPRQRSASFDQG